MMTVKAQKAVIAKGIPWLRIRTQKSGTEYYYLEIPGSADREEIALGSDPGMALKKRETLLLKMRLDGRTEQNKIVFMLNLYTEILMPTVELQKRKENTVTVTKLIEFFQNSTFTFDDIESQQLHDLYVKWRNTKSTIRIKSEIAFLKKLRTISKRWNL
jgi:hypothetical protein